MKTLNKINSADFYNNYFVECKYKNYNILYCNGNITITKNKSYKAYIHCDTQLKAFKDKVIKYITLILEK